MSGDRNESLMNPTATSSSMGGAVKLALELGHPYPGPGGPAQGSPRNGTPHGEADALGKGLGGSRGDMRSVFLGGLVHRWPLSVETERRSWSGRLDGCRLRQTYASGDEDQKAAVDARRGAEADGRVGTGEVRAAARQLAVCAQHSAPAAGIVATSKLV